METTIPNYTSAAKTTSPHLPPPHIEAAITSFNEDMDQQININLRGMRRKHNMTPPIRRLLQQASKDPTFIYKDADKNLGVCITEKENYMLRCLQDHLLDGKTYKQLTKEEAETLLDEFTSKMKELIEDYVNELLDHEVTYFRRCFTIATRIAQFYTNPKVHKNPYKLRPIVSTINSRPGYLSKWADRQLQKVVHLCPGYLPDSNALLANLQQLGKLPATSFLVTSDAFLNVHLHGH